MYVMLTKVAQGRRDQDSKGQLRQGVFAGGGTILLLLLY